MPLLIDLGGFVLAAEGDERAARHQVGRHVVRKLREQLLEHGPRLGELAASPCTPSPARTGGTDPRGLRR